MLVVAALLVSGCVGGVLTWVRPGLVGDLSVISVEPVSGGWRGGFPLTIKGSGFTTSATVKIGGVGCASISVVSSSELTCSVPNLVPAFGVVSVDISDPSGTSVRLADAFTPKFFLYVAELTAGKIHGFELSSDGSLSELPNSPLTASVSSPSNLVVAGNGKFLFSIHVAQNVVGRFRINPLNGSFSELTPTFGTGVTLSSMATHPTLSLLYGTRATSLSNLRRYQITEDGELSESQIVGVADSPRSVAVLSEGTHLYTADSSGNKITKVPLDSEGFLGVPDSTPTDSGLVNPHLVRVSSASHVLFAVNGSTQVITTRTIANGELGIPSNSPYIAGHVVADMFPLPNGAALLAVSPGTNKIYSRSISPNGDLGPESSLPIPNAVTEVEVDPTGSYAFTTHGAGGDKLKSFSVGSDGQLTPLAETSLTSAGSLVLY